MAEPTAIVKNLMTPPTPVVVFAIVPSVRKLTRAQFT